MYKLIRFFKALFSENRKFFLQIEKILGFLPKDISKYELSLTHKSAITSKSGDNERLEFLGDAVLDCIISEYLYIMYPKESEGFLTSTRSKIVNGSSLAQIARQVKINKVLIAGAQGGNNKIYEDAFEAFVGAIYIDRGYKMAKKFVENKVLVNIDMNAIVNTNTNYKSLLLEWVQKFKYELTFYTDFETPESKNFISYARVNDKTFGKGKGVSKKNAEQEAAKDALKYINTSNEVI